MGLHSVDEFENSGESPSGTATVDSADHLRESGQMIYTPPEEKPTGNIASGFAKGVAQTPQILGSFLSYLGHNFDPTADEAKIKEGNNFGDRLARMGIEMTESNKKYIAQKFPETPNLWEKIGQGVGGALPLAAILGVGAVTGADEAALTTMAAGGIAATTGVSAFGALKQKGMPTLSADLMALLPAGAAGVLTALGFGTFLKAAGGPLEQLAKGAINGYATMAAQSAASGEIEHLEGINQEDLKNRMSQYAIDGVVGAIFGGPLGMHQALRQHAKIEEGFRELGLSDEDASDATKVLMSKMMGKGMDAAEQMAGTKAQDEGRLKSLDRNGIPQDAFYPSVKEQVPTDVAVQQSQGNK